MERVYLEGEEREAPEALLEDLRRIDPTADLKYLAPLKWVLGTVQQTGGLRAKCMRLLHGPWHRLRDGLEIDIINYKLLQLGLQGFSVIQAYALRDPDGRIVRDFELRDWNYRVFSSNFWEEKAVREADLDDTGKRMKVLADAIRTTGKDGFKDATRRLIPVTASRSQRGVAA